MLNITLPDGKVIQIESGKTALDLAASISAGLAKKAPCGDAEYICANAADVYDFARDIFEREPENWFGAEALEWIKQCEAASK